MADLPKALYYNRTYLTASGFYRIGTRDRDAYLGSTLTSEYSTRDDLIRPKARYDSVTSRQGPIVGGIVMLDKELALELIQGKPWHHDFEVIPGVRTQGNYDPTGLWNELQLPADMTGLTLADVGASNGYFSFEAYKRGAEVVAFDFRHKDNSGFGLAQYINGMSAIEHHQVNVLNMTPAEYGQFDIVLALGLFYHVSDPYMALANCAALSRKRLLIESYCIDQQLPNKIASDPIMRFLPDPERFPMHGQPNADRSNFWGFSSACLQRMVEDIGFAVERANVREDRAFIDATRVAFDDEETRLNIAFGMMDLIPVNGSLDDPKAWTIY